MSNPTKKALIVLNPISGDNDKTAVLDQLVQAIEDKYQFELYRTTGEGDKEAVEKCIASLCPERILAVGGDGTIKLIAEALGEQKIPIGIIPAGSSNGLATDLDLPLNIEEAIKTALGSKTILVDTLCIDGSLGLHISDLGINAELIEKYSEGKIRGHFGYIINAVPTLFNSDYPYTFHIECNGEVKTVQGIMLAFANSRKFGTGAMVNPTGRIDDGKFEVLLFKKLDPIEILKTLTKSEDLDQDFVETIPTTRVQVTCEKPVSFQIDGEYYGKKKEILAEIIPENLEIVIGEK